MPINLLGPLYCFGGTEFEVVEIQLEKGDHDWNIVHDLPYGRGVGYGRPG